MLARAREMRPGLEEEAVQGDGNCLCHSAGRLLHLSHEKVRESLVSEVENHQSDYIGFFDDENAMQDWISSTKKQGEWCDGIAVKAAANSFGRPVVVYRKRNPDQPPSCFLPRNVEPGPVNENDLDPLCLILDEPGADKPNYKPTGCEHYNPLVSVPILDTPEKVPMPAVPNSWLIESKALAIPSLAEKTPELPEVGSPVDTPSSGSNTSGISPLMSQLAIEDGECGASIPSLNCIDELGKLEPTAAAPEKEKKKIKKRKVKKCKCCVADGEAAASPKKKVLKKSKSKKGHAAKALPKDKSEEDAGKVLGSMLVGADATDVKDAKFVEEVTPKKKKTQRERQRKTTSAMLKQRLPQKGKSREKCLQLKHRKSIAHKVQLHRSEM